MSDASPAAPSDAATFRKIAWRIVPLLFLGYIVAFLDRVNVGFAKLQMADDLGFSDAIYGFGAGRSGSVSLNRFRGWDKWISASVMLRPGLAAAG